MYFHSTKNEDFSDDQFARRLRNELFSETHLSACRASSTLLSIRGILPLHSHSMYVETGTFTSVAMSPLERPASSRALLSADE